MPIDFNPHVIHMAPAHIAINKNYQMQQNNDVFTKNVNSDNVVNSQYDGVRISERPFGKIQKTSEQSKLYTITNKNGASVDLSTFGATIVSIKVKDKDGNLKDVTQGYNNVTPYEKSPIGHAGGTIGPCANKIDKGEFELNGKIYSLEKNKDNGRTHSHGGSDGFDVKNWTPKILTDGIEFSYNKKDMESGYPGNVKAKVTYKFDNDNNLHIIYDAETDSDTVLNLTNHTYFNLDGAENAQENSVYNHIVKLPNSSKYTKNNDISVPTGEILSVEGTSLDFSSPVKLGDVIDSDFDQIKIGSGFDQNFVIDNYDGKSMIEVADVKSLKTGINLKVSTNLPGFQFYSANHLGKSEQPKGKDGLKYEKRSAFCIEPQFFPNAVNIPEFKEKPVLKSGEHYHREIIYSFSTVSE